MHKPLREERERCKEREEKGRHAKRERGVRKRRDGLITKVDTVRSPIVNNELDHNYDRALTSHDAQTVT